MLAPAGHPASPYFGPGHAAPPAYSMLTDRLQLLADGGTPLCLKFTCDSPFLPSLLWAGQPSSRFTDAAAVVATEFVLDI